MKANPHSCFISSLIVECKKEAAKLRQYVYLKSILRIVYQEKGNIYANQFDYWNKLIAILPLHLSAVPSAR